MTSVVISEAFGGFGLSQEAMNRLKESGWEGRDHDIPRDLPDLVQTVIELGSERASGRYANLVVVEIPDDVEWHIHEYDGAESIHENHRIWDSNGERDDC